MEPEGILVTVMAVVAIALFLVGLFFKRFRTIVGVLLVILGVVASLTVMGAFMGIPILIVGLIILIAEYYGRRRTGDSEET